MYWINLVLAVVVGSVSFLIGGFAFCHFYVFEGRREFKRHYKIFAILGIVFGIFYPLSTLTEMFKFDWMFFFCEFVIGEILSLLVLFLILLKKRYL